MFTDVLLFQTENEPLPVKSFVQPLNTNTAILFKLTLILSFKFDVFNFWSDSVPIWSNRKLP